MGKRSQERHSQLAVPIAGLEEKEYPFEFCVSADELEVEEFYKGEITISGVVSKVASQFFVNGHLSAVQIGDCDRCLMPTEKVIEEDFALYYRVSVAEHDAEEDEDSSEDSVRVLAPEDSTIQLDDDIRQTLRLQIPMKNLCEDECKGLCPQCGTNLNQGDCNCSDGPIDPRWAKLAGLFNKDPDADKN